MRTIHHFRFGGVTATIPLVPNCSRRAHARTHYRTAGPYVCAEWNYGGMPVWLRDYNMVFRTYDQQVCSAYL